MFLTFVLNFFQTTFTFGVIVPKKGGKKTAATKNPRCSYFYPHNNDYKAVHPKTFRRIGDTSDSERSERSLEEEEASSSFDEINENRMGLKTIDEHLESSFHNSNPSEGKAANVIYKEKILNEIKYSFFQSKNSDRAVEKNEFFNANNLNLIKEEGEGEDICFRQRKNLGSNSIAEKIETNAENLEEMDFKFDEDELNSLDFLTTVILHPKTLIFSLTLLIFTIIGFLLL